MKYQPQTYTLKSGNSIRIRGINTGESQKLLDLKRSYIGDTRTIPLTMEEYPDNIEKETRLISDYEKSPNSILLVAEINSELIGNIDLTGSNRAKMKHTAMIGMGIKQEWRNQGIGRILIESVIDWAKKNVQIEIIWLDVYASNTLGYNLYKNTGFIVSGVIKGFFKYGDEYTDKVQMYLRIRE